MNNERYLTGEAIILKYITSGEYNRLFTFISPLYGIQTAMAFGAERFKSRFCPSIQNFVNANLSLDRNPKTNLMKLDDISEINTNDFLKTNLDFIYLLSFFSDILLNTYISLEENKSFYFLLKYSMELLEEKKDSKHSFIFFTSKYFYLSGYGLNLNNCKICGKQNQNFYFDFNYHGIFCEKCAIDRKFHLSAGSVNLWKKFFENKYIELKTESIDNMYFNEIFPITFEILKNIFNKELITFNLIVQIFKKNN